jgi:hypothetical protein
MDMVNSKTTNTAATPLGGGGKTFTHGVHTYRVGVRGGVQRRGGRAKKYGPLAKAVISKLPQEVKDRIRALKSACKKSPKKSSPKKRRRSAKKSSPKKRRRSAKKSSPKKRRRSGKKSSPKKRRRSAKKSGSKRKK